MVKSRLQIQKESKKIAKYKGITDCLRQTYASGGIKAVYKGNIATILREIPGYGSII